jgi:hypothetical protein
MLLFSPDRHAIEQDVNRVSFQLLSLDRIKLAEDCVAECCRLEGNVRLPFGKPEMTYEIGLEKLFEACLVTRQIYKYVAIGLQPSRVCHSYGHL